MGFHPLTFVDEAVSQLLDHDALIVVAPGLGLHPILLEFLRQYHIQYGCHTGQTRTNVAPGQFGVRPPESLMEKKFISSEHPTRKKTHRKGRLIGAPHLVQNLTESAKMPTSNELLQEGEECRQTSERIIITPSAGKEKKNTSTQKKEMEMSTRLILLLNTKYEEAEILQARAKLMGLIGDDKSDGFNIVLPPKKRKQENHIQAIGDDEKTKSDLKNSRFELMNSANPFVEESSIRLLFHIRHPTDTDNAEQRQLDYVRGGVFVYSSRLLVTDLLCGRLPAEIIDGIIVNRAESLTNNWNDAFVLRLFRQRNRHGFLKALTDRPDSLGRGTSTIERIMKMMSIRTLHLFPRFHAAVEYDLRSSMQPTTFELAPKFNVLCNDIQRCLVELLRKALIEIQKLQKIDLSELTLEDCCYRDGFDYKLQELLDPIWSTLHLQYRQIVHDIGTFRRLMSYLVIYDAVKFYGYVDAIKNSKGIDPRWFVMVEWGVLVRKAKERLFRIHQTAAELSRLLPNCSGSFEHLPIRPIPTIPGRLVLCLDIPAKWPLLMAQIADSGKHLSESVLKRLQIEERSERFELGLTKAEVIHDFEHYISNECKPEFIEILTDEFNAPQRPEEKSGASMRKQKGLQVSEDFIEESYAESRLDGETEEKIIVAETDDIDAEPSSSFSPCEAQFEEKPHYRILVVTNERATVQKLEHVLLYGPKDTMLLIFRSFLAKEVEHQRRAITTRSGGRLRLDWTPESLCSSRMSIQLLESVLLMKQYEQLSVVDITRGGAPAWLSSTEDYERFNEYLNSSLIGLNLLIHPFVKIMTFTQHSGAFELELRSYRPHHIILMEPDIERIRAIEVYVSELSTRKFFKLSVPEKDRTSELIHDRDEIKTESPQSIKQNSDSFELTQEQRNVIPFLFGEDIHVSIMVLQGTTEHQRHLYACQTEQNTWNLLIQQRQYLVVPIDESVAVDDQTFLELVAGGQFEGSSRKAGGQIQIRRRVRQSIVVDMREFKSSLPYQISCKELDVVPIQLFVGDYVLTRDICVERKSMVDLVSSLNSGRLFDQVQAMSRSYNSPTLLIELTSREKGTPLQSREFLGGEKDNTNLIGKLCLLILQFPQMRLIWSPTLTFTAEVFAKLKLGRESPDPFRAVAIGADFVPSSESSIVEQAHASSSMAQSSMFEMTSGDIDSGESVIKDQTTAAEEKNSNVAITRELQQRKRQGLGDPRITKASGKYVADEQAGGVNPLTCENFFAIDLLSKFPGVTRKNLPIILRSISTLSDLFVLDPKTVKELIGEQCANEMLTFLNFTAFESSS